MPELIVVELKYVFTFFQNGNWVDCVCDEKHEFICMKMSASTPTGEEVLQDIGCKFVCCIHLFCIFDDDQQSCEIKILYYFTDEIWVFSFLGVLAL